MKKTLITFLISGLMITGLKAQTIQEGMGHLYAGRIQSAIGVFEKLLAVNPNNIDAIYWLGQTYLENDEIMSARIAAARKLYEKAMQSTNNAPLVLVGMGHIEMLENKTNEARQHFETALTMTRNARKGDDPVIATAIGRAITDSKTGDYSYAVRLLEDAATKDPKNTETLLQLGNAYRKAGQGQGGGQAYQTYLKALAVNPAFAVASLRLAQLFQTHNNSELVLQYLNEAVTKDPKFTLGYYELFYYYFYRLKYPEAEQQLQKYINSKLPETDIQDQYLYAQLCWARKDYECAVTKAESVVTAFGAATKPKVYRLLADAYYQKGDYNNAKKNSDMFFAKKNPDDVILPDYEVKALVLAKLGADSQEVYNTYISALSLDTTVDAKLAYLKKGAVYFKENKVREKEAQIMEKIIELKPKPIINDYFDLALAHYFSDNYSRTYEVAGQMIDKWPDQVYGYEWKFNAARASDTVKVDSIAVPAAIGLHDFAQKDSTKYKKQYIASVRFLADYYVNKAKDKEKALEYFRKWYAADTANAMKIKEFIDQIEKMNLKPGTKPAMGTPKSTGKAKAPAKSTKSTTVGTKKATKAPTGG
jgi:Flp pilus assembly protein TadD